MKIFSPNTNATFPAMDQVLVVCIPTYFAPRWERLVTGARIDQTDFYSLSFWRQVLVSKSFAHHGRNYPRKVTYMLNQAQAFLQANVGSPKASLLVDTSAAKQVSEEMGQYFERTWVAPGEGLTSLRQDLMSELQSVGFDTLLLLYPDSVGLGWSALERSLLKLNIANRLVLNGRRRVFFWDAAMRRMLLWRRILERIWLVEIVLAIGLVLLSIPLVFYDLVLGKGLSGAQKNR